MLAEGEDAVEWGTHGRRVGESEKLPRISAKTTPPHAFHGGAGAVSPAHMPAITEKFHASNVHNFLTRCRPFLPRPVACVSADTYGRGALDGGLRR